MPHNEHLLLKLDSISVIGTKRRAFFSRLVNGEAVFDLLSHLPSTILHRTSTDRLSLALLNQLVTIHFKVDEHLPNSRRGMPYRIIGRVMESDQQLEILAAQNVLKSYME